MRTPKDRTTTCLFAAVVMLMLTALPTIAAADYVDCNPAACPSPVLGPGNHLDVETR